MDALLDKPPVVHWPRLSSVGHASSRTAKREIRYVAIHLEMPVGLM
jgi:hypothetical protein